ncbi:hypothetical protein [Salipiger sp. PrR003]|uniref:hypothetical protein n=1 Tax=Salipiger sp. PrR003 TaxID=2706776 RepID=UPI0013DCAACD|nr:hypothetical protein [Salipiger sp. PrR003]NDV49309.1 hypothetical protein [Salipiger sp. PrR003]
MTVWNWIQQNADGANVLLNGLMVLVWVIYLQLLLVSFARQRRSVLHLDLGVATDENARCILTNMGSEPIYIAAIVVELCYSSATHSFIVTDRKEMPVEEANRPLERTTKGPLGSGEALDIGSFNDLADRTRGSDAEANILDDLVSVAVTAIAASNQAQKLVGAYKRFNISRSEQIRRFRADSVTTRQLRGPLNRRRFEALLTELDTQ